MTGDICERRRRRDAVWIGQRNNTQQSVPTFRFNGKKNKNKNKSFNFLKRISWRRRKKKKKKKKGGGANALVEETCHVAAFLLSSKRIETEVTLLFSGEVFAVCMCTQNYFPRVPPFHILCNVQRHIQLSIYRQHATLQLTRDVYGGTIATIPNHL